MRLPAFSSARRILLATACIAAVSAAVACGDGDKSKEDSSNGDGGPFEAVITSADIAVGKQRFAFVLLKDNKPIREHDVTVRFFRLKDPQNPQLLGEGVIPWSPIGATDPADDHAHGSHDETELDGVYYANLEFPEAGQWGAGFTLGSKADPEKEVRVSFEVRPKTQTLGVGDRGIPVDNPTLTTRPLKQIDTSPVPDEAMHKLSITDAMKNGKPTLIAFATPAFCASRTCGPTMAVVRAAQEKYGSRVNFLHIEPYELDADGNLLGNKLQPVAAGTAWRLPSEPWVFILDSKGVVAARMDGPVSLEEVEAYLDHLQ